MALNKQKVLVTRAQTQAEEFAQALIRAGAEPVKMPVIEIRFLEAELPAIEDFDLLILTSKNGVDALSRQLDTIPKELQVVCVGQKTSMALTRSFPATKPIVPERFDEDGIISLLKSRLGPFQGRRVLCPQAVQAKARFADYLREQGAIVELLPMYSIEKKTELGPLDEMVEYVTFFSGRSLEAFVEHADAARAYLNKRRIAVIGEVTAARADELDVRVDIIPAEATLEAMIEAIKKDMEDRER